MAGRSLGDIEKIRANVEGVKRLSDRVVGIGPFGVGLDGLLTFVPAVGTAYTVGAGGWLLWQGARARVRRRTLARMAAYLAFDGVTGSVPLLGSAVDFFFPGHLMAAKALQKEIDLTHWVEADEAEARTSGDHDRHLADMRAARKKRLVYLSDRDAPPPR